MTDKKKDLLETALESLKRSIPEDRNVSISDRKILKPDSAFDAEIVIGIGEVNLKAKVLIVRRISHSMVGALINQCRASDTLCFIVSEYIFPKIAEKLKDANVCFFDSTGNIYLNTDDIFVFVRGNKPESKPDRKKMIRAFQPSGAKVLYALLCKPDLINGTYRNIAEASNVSLGSVSRILRDLKRLGYLVEMDKNGRLLKNKENLFRRWTRSYLEKLRSGQLTGRYDSDKPGLIKDLNLTPYNAYWSGEVAAAMMSNFIKPQTCSIYCTEDTNRLILDNGLRKDPRGKIEVLNAFWNFKDDSGPEDTVHPILVYADLVFLSDSRTLETAERIFDERISGYLGQN